MVNGGKIVVAGDSSYAWALVEELAPTVRGRLYFLLPDHDRALEASVQEHVVAVEGQITDTNVLDQLGLGQCFAFIAASRESEANILSALYAKQKGVTRVFARVSQAEFAPLVASLGVTPLQTSQVAAGFMALQLLKPSVAQLVSQTTGVGRFALEEIHARDYPELVGCRLGNLQSEHLHIIAVSQDDGLHVGYATSVDANAKLIVLVDKEQATPLKQEIRKVAAEAMRRLSER